MVAAAVKATLIQSGTASASSSVSATAGNALIVGGAAFNSTNSWTVTRSGDTFTTDVQGLDGSSDLTAIASAPNVGAGPTTCQVASTGATGISAWAFEVSGLPTSAIKDANSPATNTGTSTTPTSLSLTNVTADAIYVCCFGSGNGNTTVSPGSGYTNVVGGVTMAETQGLSNMVGGLEFQVVSTTAGRTGSWTVGASSTWACTIAVYKAAAGGAAQDTPELRGRPNGIRGQNQMQQLLAT